MWHTVPCDILTLSYRTRRRNITTVDEFVAMKNQDRRSLVRVLSDEDYLDVMAVCSNFPHIDLNTETQGEALFPVGLGHGSLCSCSDGR